MRRNVAYAKIVVVVVVVVILRIVRSLLLHVNLTLDKQLQRALGSPNSLWIWWCLPCPLFRLDYREQVRSRSRREAPCELVHIWYLSVVVVVVVVVAKPSFCVLNDSCSSWALGSSPVAADIYTMSKKEGLLDPRTMDGPVVTTTVADWFQENARVAVTYHVVSAGFASLTPIGAAVGGALWYSGLYKPFPTALPMLGTAGLVAGGAGMALGYFGMRAVASQGADASPIPWTEDGIQQRVNGLSHNFKVRVLDLSLWSGMGLATGAMLFAGGPASLGLSSGTLGVLQGLSLGAAAGTLGAIGCVIATRQIEDKDDE